MTKQHTYSEIFYSIQGEGHYTGVPTAWLRFFMCNLQCNGFGQKDPTDKSTYELPYKDFDAKSVTRIEDMPVWKFGCDSSYSWAAKFKHLQHKKTAAEICDDIQNALKTDTNPDGLFRHPHSNAQQHMCFTGGEPLMPHAQAAVIDILREFKARDNQPLFITFETNGTQPLTDEFVNFFNDEYWRTEVFFSVSPKLFTVSGEKADKAIKPDIVQSYYSMENAFGQIKPVVGAEDRQWEELESVVAQFREAGIYWPVWVMPVGATEEGQAGEYGSHAAAGKVAEIAYKRGYNVSSRVHVYLWGNLIGV
ncbi:NrdG Organic radical activating enzymes [uncultured Caudovirales phage]|uniref:NrdG Organic radical activating enzymes n=1 Tax=uncultured Caudovirales phage TaxID=2100421 RepID=A0A6J5M9B3_9CAUD|nr:NrdG Organic radical activating enzymes [uncultured Caudovirales phage]